LPDQKTTFKPQRVCVYSGNQVMIVPSQRRFGP
jgi:hypothetical protein